VLLLLLLQMMFDVIVVAGDAAVNGSLSNKRW